MKTPTTNKRAAMLERIEKHGRQLLAIFPKAVVQNPVKLCKHLRLLESSAAAVGLRMCNGPEYPEGVADKLTDGILTQVNTLLGNRHIDQLGTYGNAELVPIFVNRDPRGYALKIEDEWMRAHRDTNLHSDWGGYGIIAPDLSEND